MSVQPNVIITSKRIRDRYKAVLDASARRSGDLSTAVDILHRTHWWDVRPNVRRRRRWAKGVLRKAIRGGVSAWYRAPAE